MTRIMNEAKTFGIIKKNRILGHVKRTVGLINVVLSGRMANASANITQHTHFSEYYEDQSIVWYIERKSETHICWCPCVRSSISTVFFNQNDPTDQLGASLDCNKGLCASPVKFTIKIRRNAKTEVCARDRGT